MISIFLSYVTSVKRTMQSIYHHHPKVYFFHLSIFVCQTRRIFYDGAGVNGRKKSKILENDRKRILPFSKKSGFFLNSTLFGKVIESFLSTIFVQAGYLSPLPLPGGTHYLNLMVSGDQYCKKKWTKKTFLYIHN